jgi:diphthine-ammonia ligase
LDAVVLWSGGKDSCLALWRARQSGLHVRSLVTFAPPAARFLAHPLPVLREQAQALGLLHLVLEVVEPHEASYRAHLRKLVSAGVSAIITGDICEVDGHPNFIAASLEGASCALIRPLWQAERKELLQELIEARFNVIFSCVKRRWFTADWVGRKLDPAAFERLCAVRDNTGMDLCGEQGEYHTLVLDGPMFNSEVQLIGDAASTSEGLHYLDVREVSLRRQQAVRGA